MTRGHLECLSGVLYKLEECSLSLSHGVSRRYIETWRDVSIENGTRSYKTDNGCLTGSLPGTRDVAFAHQSLGPSWSYCLAV